MKSFFWQGESGVSPPAEMDNLANKAM